MSKYKTSKQLGIQTWERKALIDTMKHLSKIPDFDGSVKDTKEGENYFAIGTTAQSKYFDHDGFQRKEYNCGTIACIGGWAYLIAHGFTATYEADDYVISMNMDYPLYGLFYPSGDWGLINTKMAIKAIDNFLTTGDPKWRELQKEAR